MHVLPWGNSRPRIAVVGDIMVDEYIRGAVHRVSPEAPVPVLLVEHVSVSPGGAGNTAVNVVGIGGNCSLLGVIGEGDGATAQMIAGLGVDPLFLYAKTGHRTSRKVRCLAGCHHMLRIDTEAPVALTGRDQDAIIEALSKHEFDLLVVSDYGKGVCSFELMLRLFAYADEAGIPVLVDPKGTDFGKYAGASCVTPNLAEAIQAVGKKAHPFELAEEICDRFGIERCIVTLGEHGAVCVAGNQRRKFESFKVVVADTCGAGDTFLATLAVCVATGLDYFAAVPFANLAASIACRKVGAVPVSYSEIRAAFDETDSPL